MNNYPNTIRVYRARDGWRWRMTARNGNIVADSGQRYSTREHARRAARSLAGRPIVVAPIKGDE